MHDSLTTLPSQAMSYPPCGIGCRCEADPLRPLPVQVYGQGRRVGGVRGNDEEAVAVGSEVPSSRAGANSGIHYVGLEQRIGPDWNTGCVLTSSAIIFESGEMQNSSPPVRASAAARRLLWIPTISHCLRMEENGI